MFSCFLQSLFLIPSLLQDLPSELKVGRISLPRARALVGGSFLVLTIVVVEVVSVGSMTWNASCPLQLRERKKPFVEIRRSLHAIERIACSVKHNEPVLLVGETGTGKTTLVQNLALRLGQRLTVLVGFWRLVSVNSYLFTCMDCRYKWKCLNVQKAYVIMEHLSSWICMLIFSYCIIAKIFIIWFQNLSQQSDIADLLGGFKPMNAQYVCIPLYEEFEDLFSKTFSVKVLLTVRTCWFSL